MVEITTGDSARECGTLPLHTHTYIHTLVTSLGCHLYSWPSSYFQLEVPITPFWGLINLLEWPTEHKEKFYSLNRWFVTTGCNSGHLDRRDARDKYGERAWSFHALWTPCSPPCTCVHQPRRSQTLSSWVLMKASLPRHGWLNHWPLGDWFNLQALSPPQRSEGGAESSNLPIRLVLLVACTQPETLSKVTSLM